MTDKVADGGGDWSSMTNGIDGDGGRGPPVRRTDAESLRDMQLSIAASSSVFPGFRFSPTDDELISYYLKKKLQGSDQCVNIIPEVDFCRHEPWDLPARGKKYPNGSQSKRATQSGYWKATGKERNVKSGVVTIGTKRTLVFHTGRAPKGERTEWIMHEYCMSDTTQESLVVCRLRRNSDFRLNESSRGSSDHNRSLSVADNDQSGTNEYVNNTLTDGFNEVNAKESTSSYRSHSDEQNDSESESYQEAIHESPHGSSSLYKSSTDVDDCFADIINDDIIQLDESTSHPLKFHGFLNKDLPTIWNQEVPQQTVAAARPFSGQGTAFRRIKLRHPKGRTNGARDCPPKPSENNTAGCIFSIMSGRANTLVGSRTTHVILVLLFLVMMFVGWEGYMGASGLVVCKKQLNHWLRKAADYM